MFLRASIAAVLVGSALFALAGCGGSGSKGYSSTPAPLTNPAGRGATTTPAANSQKAAPVRLATRDLPGLGRVLVDAQGDTLYTFSRDHAKQVTCLKGCASVWPPLQGSKATGTGINKALLGSVRDPDGGTVITYAGWPLYLYVSDSGPGSHSGQAFDNSGGLWYVISPSGKRITKRG